MRIHEPLNKIMNSKVKVKVLRFLYRNDTEWSGRQIAREISISPATSHKALQELHSERVLLLRNVGKTHLYQLNWDSYAAKELLSPLFKKEARLPKVITRLLKDELSEKIKDKVVSIALFGSVEKREDGPESDIDLLILTKDSSDKNKIEKAFASVNEKTMRLFGKIVSPYVESVSGFGRKYRSGLPLIKDIISSHRLIFGKPLGEVISSYRSYIRKAEEFHETMYQAKDRSNWNAVGLNGVHCAISSNDALLVFYAGIRSASEDHNVAVDLLSSSLGFPEIKSKSETLRRILAKKNLVEYENREFTQREALDMIKLVDRFYRWAKEKLSE